jgi:hypothetical protein
VAGVTVTATADGTAVGSATSGPDGQAHLRLRAGGYWLRAQAPAGYTVTVAPDAVTVTGGATSVVRVALRVGEPASPGAGPETGTTPGLPATPGGAGGGGGGGAGVPPLTDPVPPRTPAAPTAPTVKPRAKVPSAPRIATAVSGKYRRPVTATARWRAPSTNGGKVVTRYQVVALRLDKKGRVLSKTYSGRVRATARSLQMRLPRAGTYRFQVRAYNAVGAGRWSARSNRVAGR